MMEADLNTKKEKARAYSRRWYERNKEYVIKRVREWEKNNPERFKLREREYNKNRVRVNDPQKNAEYTKRYRTKNPEKVKESARRYLLANRERVNTFNKLWRQRNPDKWCTINRAQRHKRRAIGKISSTEWIAKVAMLENRCQMCFKTEPEVKITIDHIIPVSKGGTNHIDNLQPLCRSCNSSKGARTT